MKQGDVAGILYLPADFEARVARGETSVFVLYAATDAFLNFKGLQESSARVMLAVNDAHRMEAPYSYLRKDCWQWLRPLPSACPARRSTTIQRATVPI